MATANQLDRTCDLEQEIAHWIRAEEANLELKDRVASALDELKDFIGEQRSELKRRKGRLLQTGSFRRTTGAMEAALATIEELFDSGRNVSRIFADADKYIAAFKVDDTLSRLHTRTQLADAHDAFMGAFQESIRGTRLAGLLDILHFMPFSCWRARGLERRNYRSPSAAEILGLLGELGRRQVDFNRIDVVQLAAVIRLQLGITPRMDYHAMSANKLAELLTSGENLTRFTAKALPVDAGFCRVAAGILADLRRWPDELFGDAAWRASAELEAEMLQIVFLAADAVSISGAGVERSIDFLWVLATVIAGDHAILKDAIASPAIRNSSYPALSERLLGTKKCLDKAAVLADAVLVARWSEARVALNSLADRSAALSSKSAHQYDEFMDLEELKEKRADVVKSLIKSADSLQLIEPALLDVLAAGTDPAEPPTIEAIANAPDPVKLMDRNRAIREETTLVARQELDKLRLLIGRIATISRHGFAVSPAQQARDRALAAATRVRKTTDGVEIGSLSTAAVQERLLGALRKALASVREIRGKIDGARKRTMKNELLQALNALNDKIGKAADVCETIAAETLESARAPAAAETVAPLLREILMAQTSFSKRLNTMKLTPAEKQPLATLVNALKAKVHDDLRDLDMLGAELAVRSAETTEPLVGADSVPELIEAERGADVSPAATVPAARAPERVPVGAAAQKMAALSLAANAALKPVKEQISLLNTRLTGRDRDGHAILEATRDVRTAIAAARESMTEKLALIETVAAAFDTTCEVFVDKFNRWHRQLAAVDMEADRLAGVTAGIVGVEAGVKHAATLARQATVPSRLLAAEVSGDRDLVTARERCTQARESIAAGFKHVREMREACAAAAGAGWLFFTGASGYLAGGGAALEACEAALIASRTWIEELQTILGS